MRVLDLTFDTPEKNLACDEALLQMCENGFEDEILRFWESPQYFVVLGYGGKVKDEIDLKACQSAKIPVLRRVSGGGTVLQGPGCLNYALILKFANFSQHRNISQTNQTVMERHRSCFETLLNRRVRQRGITDLSLDLMKFSGNAQRRLKNFLLFHGSFLLDFDIPKVDKFLKLPSRQPAYRQNRSHQDFLGNIHLPQEDIKKALQETWMARDPLDEIPHEQIGELIKQKYSQTEWNLKL